MAAWAVLLPFPLPVAALEVEAVPLVVLPFRVVPELSYMQSGIPFLGIELKLPYPDPGLETNVFN